MSPKNSISRRSFLHATAATAATGYFSSWAAAEESRDVNSQIRVAVIGVNGRGQSHIAGLASHVVALCDCDESILAQRAQEFEVLYGRKVDTVVDFRKLLERDDIDAVAIATPNHTHSLIGILAAQAGKQIYCEKPVSHNVWEGRQLVNAAQKYDRVIQCGTQSRSSSAIREAVDWVQAGELGKILYALGTCYKPRPSIGKLDQPLQIPASIDYDLWCGPAAKVDLYRSKLHYDWHWDSNTGNGDMGNQGIHQMDIARWFLGHQGLSPRVISIGGRVGYDDAGDTPNTQITLHDYPGAPLLFETRGLPRSKAGQKNWGKSMDYYRGSRVGVIVQCEEGHVLVTNDYASATAFDRRGNEVKRWKGASDHYQNFIEAVRAGDSSLLNGPILEGHISSGLCHTGGVSHQLGEPRTAGEIAEQIAGNDLLASSADRMFAHLRANEVDVDSPTLILGQTLEMDPATELFTNNDGANQLLRREGHGSFVVPTVDV